LQRIREARYDLPPDAAISAVCEDLIRRILVREPAQRITLQRIQAHPWCTAHPAAVLQQGPRPAQTEADISRITSMARDISKGGRWWQGVGERSSGCG
jgi:hypothetical protein